MRKLMAIAIFAAALTVVAPVAAQDTTKDIETLRGLILEQARAINAHDPDGVLKHYSRDIIVSYPGIPDTTYATFEANYRRMMNPGIATQSTPTIDEILVSGDLATIRMMWSTTITDKATGKATSRQAKDLQVWRREKGAWKFYRGMWHHIWPDGPKPAQIAISVPNLDAASQWYQQMLGLVVRDDRRFPEAKLRVAFLERQGIRVELVEMQGSISKASVNNGLDNPAMVQGFGKVGFIVADVDGWANTLRTRGVRFQLEPQTDPQTGARSFIVLDNNGNWLQFSSQ
jgi:steroid delta-isomerase